MSLSSLFSENLQMETNNYNKFFPDEQYINKIKKISAPVKQKPIVEILFSNSDDSDDEEDTPKSEITTVVDSSSDEDSEEYNEEEYNEEEEKKETYDFLPPDPIFGLKLVRPYTLYEHQIEAINWMKKIENADPKRLNMRGAILAESPGLGKCLRFNTLVLLWNGTIKKAGEISPGDIIMGDDNKPRNVISVTTGKDEMYRINQNKGDWYEVNKEHILSLKYSGHKGYYWSDDKKHFRLTWMDTENYNECEKIFDTTSSQSKNDAFTSMMAFRDTISDDGIVDIEVYKYLKLNKSIKNKLKGFKVGFDGWKKKELKIDPWAFGYWLFNTKKNGTKEKYIPEEYLINSRENRLKLLAGIVDYNGYVSNGYYEIPHTKLYGSKLIENIVYLCRSLGFYTRTIIDEQYHRIIFGGEGIKDVPSILHREKFSQQKQMKDALLTSIDVEHVGYGDYVGFVIDGNRRFLLGDFTVTHNTCIAACLCMTESHDPKEPLKRIFPNDITNMIDKYVVSHSYPNLVVCSKTVAYSWKKEIAKFFGDSCPFFYFHRSDLKKNFDLITYDAIKNYKIIITTYETVMGVASKNKVTDNQFHIDQFNRRSGIKSSRKPTHEECMKATGGMLLFKVPWNRIIADESHRFANPTSSTFYSMMALWGEKKWNLSGTPLRNYSSDLYSQFRFNGYDKFILAKQFNYAEYERGKMSDFTLYKTYEAAGIVLPPITRHKIEIVLEDREKEIYDYYHNSMKQVYNGFLVGSYGFSNVLTLFLRLRQLCVVPYSILAESSRNYKGKDEEEYTLSQKILDGMTGGLASWVKDKSGTAGIDSSKMKTLISLLKSFKRGEKTLVFTSFKKVIDVAVSAMDEYMPDIEYLVLDGDVTGDNRDNTINNFKDPAYNYSVLFISYKVGSEGLTLVEAQNVIHMENWWTPVVQEQAERRVWRIGQTKPVNVYSITIVGSIEEKIDTICTNKNKMIDDFKSSNGKGIIPKLDSITIGRMLR